ncbi:hypothetical protein D3C86_1421370 [compost metagenome]
MGEPQVQRHGGYVIATQIKIQLIAGHAGKRLFRQHLEVDAHHRGLAAVGVADFLQGQRVQVDVGAGAKLAGDAIYLFGKQRRALGNQLALTDRIDQWCKTDDGRTGQRPQVVGPEHLQQRMGQLRQIVVDLHPQLGGEKGKALQQPLHVRVAGLIAEKLRQLRVVLGKLTAEFAQIAQLFGKALFQVHRILISRGCSRRGRALPPRSAPVLPCG